MRRGCARRSRALAGAEVPDPGPGPFLQDFAAQCEALIEAAPAVASSIMGLFPPEIVARLKARGIAWICNATTVAEARAAEAAGADAVVAQGAEAGGHRGTFENAAAEAAQVGLFALLPQIADAVRIPVIAAGGIMDGRGIAAALTLGASAVQLGTAFLRCPEAAIHPAWAAAIASAAPEDTVLTRGFSGRLARGIRNRVTEAFAGDAPPGALPGAAGADGQGPGGGGGGRRCLPHAGLGRPGRGAGPGRAGGRDRPAALGRGRRAAALSGSRQQSRRKGLTFPRPRLDKSVRQRFCARHSTAAAGPPCRPRITATRTMARAG